MSANNVVEGPWGKLPHSPEDKEIGDQVKATYLFLMTQLLNNMELSGIDTLDDLNYTYDLALIAEAIRSYVFKTQNKYHPCQDIANELFHWDQEGLKINPSINVEFK